jgi:hypothetical protein
LARRTKQRAKSISKVYKQCTLLLHAVEWHKTNYANDYPANLVLVKMLECQQTRNLNDGLIETAAIVTEDSICMGSKICRKGKEKKKEKKKIALNIFYAQLFLTDEQTDRQSDRREKKKDKQAY